MKEAAVGMSMYQDKQKVIIRPDPSKVLDQSNEGPQLFHETVLQVDPNSPNLGIQLGFDKSHNAIHVISIQPHSQAGLDGILKDGDRVVEVNYQDIQQLPAPEALKRIKAMCHKANFVHIK
ncbi:hypothetical protein X801_07139, partial [Opisthorchis viverrini]